MPKYTLTVLPGANDFEYGQSTYSAGSKFETDDPCEAIAFYDAGRTTNPDLPRRDATRKFWGNIDNACQTQSVASPQPAPATPAVESNPSSSGGDSASQQGAPTPPASGILGERPTSGGSIETNPAPTEEPTRPPNGEPHPTHGDEQPQKQTDAGDPIDIFNGALYLQETDLEIPNTIMPLTFTRFYRSGAAAFGPFGWNWDHNYDLYMRELSTGNIALWRNLHEDIFVFDGVNFEPPRGVFEKLMRVPGIDQSYEVMGTGGITMRFERPVGWIDGERIPIVWLRDRHGNQLKYAYGAEDKLIEVTDDDGRFFRFGYDQCGLLVSVEDQAGRKYTYEHDEETQHLVHVTTPPTTDHPEGITRIYHYEQPFTLPELRHNILRIEDGEGCVYLENEYEQDPASWSYARITEQLYGDFLFQFRYTQLQWVPANPIFINIPAVQVEVMNPDFGLETYTFNYRGDLIDHRWRLNKDKSFRVIVWQYEYDEQGNLSVITKPDGSREINTFDAANPDPRMRRNLLQRELTSAIGFPAPSRIVWKGTHEPKYQLLMQEENEKGSVTKYRYDFDLTPAALTNSGKPKQIIYPDATLPDGTIQNCITQFEHNSKGQITVGINPDGIREELFYGATGNETSRLIIKRTDPGGLNLENYLHYDNFGYLEEKVDGNGNSIKSNYNALGQLEQRKEPAIDGIEAITFFHYNADKKMIATDKPKGSYGGIADSHIIDRYERDVLGYRTKIVLSDNTPEKRTLRLCNDYRGNPIEISNPDGSVIKRLIDERGLLVYEELQGEDGKRVSSKNVYDRTGRLTQEMNSEGLTTTYTYDGFGRIVKVDLPNNSQLINTWGENDLLLVEETVGDNGRGDVRLLRKTTYDYDEKDRKIKEIISSFSDNPADAVDLETQFYYDEMGRLAKIQDLRGAQKSLSYDNAGRLIKETDAEGNVKHYTFDANGNMIRIDSYHKEPSGATTVLSKQFAYDTRNRRTQITEPDGVISSEDWDDRHLLVGRTDQLGVSNEIQYNSFGEKVTEILDTGGLSITHEWSIDNMGRLISYRDPSGQVSHYTYDSLGRLEKIEYPNGFSSRKTYTSNGLINREELGSGVVFEYSFDTANRLKTIINSNSPVSISSVPPHQFNYDGLDRVVLADSGTNQVLRTYDSLSRITSETTNGDILLHSYDDINGLVNKTWSDGRTERYTHNLNGVVSNITQMSSGSLGSGSGVIANFLPSGPAHFGLADYRNNFKIEATYDERKRLIELTMNNGMATDENLKYRYDTANRKRVEAIVGNNSKISQHDFDHRSRLVTSKHGLTTPIPNAHTQAENDTAIAVVQGNSGTALFEEEFSYNSTDERLKYSETGKSDKSYSYVNGHRIQSDGLKTYTFHIDGTLSNDGTLDFKTDSMGRVIRIEEGGTTILEIEYDALGRLSIIQESNKPKLTFNYFGKFVEQENHNGVPHRQYTLHPLTGIPIAYHITGTSFYSLFDSRSNLIALTDTGGNLLETYRYKSFGLPAIFDSGGTELSSSAFNVEPIFGGQRYIDSAGLYLSLKRLMNPVDGIFLSPDPKGYINSPSLYVYVAQNPIDYFDPSGEEKSSDDDWKLFDNPIWNVWTNDALGLTTTLLEVADARGNFETLSRYFGWMESFGKNPFSRFLGRIGSKASYFLDDLVRLPAIKFPSIFSRGFSITSLGMSRINAVLAPLGLISNSLALHEALFKRNKSTWVPDALFSGAGLFSSSIGTTALIGKGLTSVGLTSAGGFLLNIATKAGPAGLVLGAAAGGYAAGSLIRKTGYGDTAGWLGASVTKKLLEYDSFLPDFIDTGGSYAIGFTVTVGGVVIVEPVVYLGKGLKAIDEAIMPEGRTLNPITGIKSILNWENPFW